jgi:hypothetical protein
MTRVTVDADLRKKLMNCTTPLELCDEQGYILAKLVPSTPWTTDPANWIELTPPVSEEELDRRSNSNEPTYSTQEVIEMLKKV